MKVLVTGGAGFIGSYICENLLKRGHKVVVLDNLDPQIHGVDATWPDYMPAGTENIIGDIRDRNIVGNLVSECDAVIHLAAAVGVGQSMYKIEHYCSVSVVGTAVLLEEILKNKDSIQKLIVASSMSIYGEGAYEDEFGNGIMVNGRKLADMQNGNWEHWDSEGNQLIPVGVTESKPLKPDSIYAINKRDQEEMCLSFGKAYGIPTVAFRMFNVFGARQALSNPYTGVAAIFSNKLLLNEAPDVFEDGNQRRDFIHVEDVARAYVMALENSGADGLALNLGSGESITVLEIAKTLADSLGKNIKPNVTSKFRSGDIRHCYADISLIKEKLGWEPQYNFNNGLGSMLEWLVNQKVSAGNIDSTQELGEFGLIN